VAQKSDRLLLTGGWRQRCEHCLEFFAKNGVFGFESRDLFDVFLLLHSVVLFIIPCCLLHPMRQVGDTFVKLPDFGF
jgi:hypothetical protein